jgi:hypothetical protein
MKKTCKVDHWGSRYQKVDVHPDESGQALAGRFKKQDLPGVRNPNDYASSNGTSARGGQALTGLDNRILNLPLCSRS